MHSQQFETLRSPRPASRSTPRHIVQFYEESGFLCAAVAEYLADGVREGQPLVVIATEAHRRLITFHLRAKGFDFDAARRDPPCLWIDAHAALATFMVGSTPDADLFRANVGQAIDAIRRTRPRAPIRAYGEMVDLLAQDGNLDGAVRLEALWNDLARSHPFALLCAYAVGNFSEESDAAGFADICHLHAHVIPTEAYTQADDESRLREISRLQQQAHALKTEIARREELEQRLRDALTREQGARIEAESAVRAKRDFLAVMSHELRTPLNAIGGYVQLVEMGVHGSLTDAQRDALARAQRSQRHLLALINQVLNFSRIEQGHLDYALAPVAVAPLVADSCAIIEPLLLPKRLTCEGEAAPIAVQADAEKLQQILLNLLSNAIKFSATGGRITVEVVPDPISSSMVRIRVCDTGAGIADSDHETIFAPFAQVVSNPNTRREGAGLGLAISRNLARGMGGDLTVTSSLGAGATFTVSLPRA